MKRPDWIWEWLPEQGTGSERFVHETIPAGHLLRGEIAAILDGVPIEARYLVEADAGWATRAVRIEIAQPRRVLEIRSNGTGRWSDAQGIWIPALDGCIDVDTSLTPATNTLPIRRLGANPGAGMEIAVAYVLAPELTLRARPQRYIRLADRLWRFAGQDIDFTTDITVDEHGFAIDYPGLFRRAG